METSEAAVVLPGHGGDPIAGFLARPAAAGPWPAVVVVHEVFGPADHVRDMCRRLAAEGFVALLPDLFHRERGGRFPEGEADLVKLREFVATLPDVRMIGDLAAAAAHLRGRPEVRRDGVGTVGFCMGGIYAFHLACEPGAVRACVDFYGRVRYDRSTPEKPRGNLERAAEVRCPVLGIFGAMDHLIPLKDVLALKEALGPRGHVIAYPRAGHGFLDPARSTHRAEDAADAWRRAITFLRENLAPDLLPDDAEPSVPEFPPPPPSRPWGGGGRPGGRPGGGRFGGGRHGSGGGSGRGRGSGGQGGGRGGHGGHRGGNRPGGGPPPKGRR